MACFCRIYTTFSGPGAKVCCALLPQKLRQRHGVSWTTMFAFEPRLVARVVGKPE
jgi:hypothetical protein